jgi:hypothetical protein
MRLQLRLATRVRRYRERESGVADAGGRGASGNTGRSGNLTALDEYTQWQWITVGEDVPSYPF